MSGQDSSELGKRTAAELGPVVGETRMAAGSKPHYHLFVSSTLAAHHDSFCPFTTSSSTEPSEITSRLSYHVN